MSFEGSVETIGTYLSRRLCLECPG